MSSQQDCELIRRWISLSEDHELTPERTEILEAHLDRCGDCRAWHEQFLSGMDVLDLGFDEVVGEIDVGYDFDEYTPRKRHQFEALADGIYVMDSRVPISEANDVLGASFPDRESHTVGGLVTARLRRIPRAGDHIEESGWRIVVEEASDRVAVRLRVESTHHN